MLTEDDLLEGLMPTTTNSDTGVWIDVGLHGHAELGLFMNTPVTPRRPAAAVVSSQHDEAALC